MLSRPALREAMAIDELETRFECISKEVHEART